MGQIGQCNSDIGNREMFTRTNLSQFLIELKAHLFYNDAQLNR